MPPTMSLVGMTCTTLSVSLRHFVRGKRDVLVVDEEVRRRRSEHLFTASSKVAHAGVLWRRRNVDFGAEFAHDTLEARSREHGDDRMPTVRLVDDQHVVLPLHVVDFVRASGAPCLARRSLELVRIVGVNVHFDRRRRADNEQRFTARLEQTAQIWNADVGVLEHELGAVLVLADELCRREDALSRNGRRGNAVARTLRLGQKAQDALEKIDEAGAARIDDSGFFQYRQLIGRTVERVVCRPKHAVQPPVKVPLV